MKASSIVLRNLQAPDTIFGLPPKFALVLVGVALMFGVLLVLVGYGNLAFLATLAVLVPGALWLWRWRRNDPHCETITYMPRNFFRGKSQRFVTAGGPLSKK